MKTAARRFGIDRNVAIIVLSMFFWGMGLMLYDALLPVHLTRLGATPMQMGLVFSGAYLITALASIPGGWLADRFNRKIIMVLCWSLGTPSVLFFAYASRWEQTLPGIALYFVSFTTFPAVNAYLTDASDHSGLSAAFALMYATFPAAQLVGSGLGGVIADTWGMRSLFLISFGFYALSTSVILFLEAQPPKHYEVNRPVVWKAFGDRKFMAFATAGAFVYILISALLRFTSPYLKEMGGLSLTMIGLLNSAAAVGGVALTLLMGNAGDRRGRTGTLTVGILLFGLSLLIIGKLPAVGWLTLAFLLQGAIYVIRSLLDSVVGAFGKGQQAGAYFGAFGLLASVGQSIAPALGGYLYRRDPAGAFGLMAVALGVLAAAIWLGWRKLAT